LEQEVRLRLVGALISMVYFEYDVRWRTSIGATSNGVMKMRLPEPEDERSDAQSQAQGRRAQWQRPELRRIEAGSAEANPGPGGDLGFFS
jgi:hypothetical protein